MEGDSAFAGNTAVSATNEYPSVAWPTVLDIPLKASEELVSIDLETDLPDDPADLRTLLVEESSDKEHWLTIAIAYCNQGKIQDGIALIRMALEVFHGAERASLHTLLSWAHLTLAKKDTTDPHLREQCLVNAENDLKDAIGFDPTWVGNMLATVDLYYQRGHYDKALETSDLFVKSIHAEERRAGKQPKINCLFLLMRAKLLYQKKNYMASLKSFQELLVTNPVLKPDPRIGIGLCFWQLKDYQMAISAWERALELDPENKTASILCLLGKFHNSITDSKNDTQFTESFTKVLTELNDIYTNNKENPVLLILLQSYYYFTGDYSRVIKIYEAKISPNASLITPTLMSDSTFWCGRAQYALNNYREAFVMFQESLKTNEDNLLARFGVGQSQIKTNLVEESILTFENLYKTNENIQELNYVLGLLYAEKCLNTRSRKKLSGKDSNFLITKALQYLEKYINLTTAKKNQLIIKRAYLVMSELYELQNQYKKSLELLSKAAEELQLIDDGHVPPEVFNNLGFFHFINGDHAKAMEYFDKTKKLVTELKDKSLELTIDFNIGRTLEGDQVGEAQDIYKGILTEHPAYVAARIRSLFCQILNREKTTTLAHDLKQLLHDFSDDLEVRAFYSWYLKNCDIKDSDALETAHSKETLVKYDSHDLYALISLANLYCVIAKEAKKSSSSKEQEKSKHSYLKATQLYQKVLQIDPLNVFAAQGIAIVFAESKRLGPALEIFRKVRDSIHNVDVHINIAHCLLEMNDYVKAAENYEIILKKFDKEIPNRAYILNLLGKVWYLRGCKERNVGFLQKSLGNIKLAIEDESCKTPLNGKFLNRLQFNLTLLQFQILETLRRSAAKNRTLADLKSASEELTHAVSVLKHLRDADDFKIVSQEELEQRIQLAETTMRTSLDRCITEQEAFEREQNSKLDEARKILEMKEQQERETRAKEDMEKLTKLARQKEEYQRLQDEAQKLIQERETFEVGENDVAYRSSDSGAVDDDAAAAGDGKRQKKRKTKQGTKAKRTKRDAVAESSDGDSDGEEIAVRKRAKRSANADASVEESDREEAQLSPPASDDDQDGLF
ncbi:Ctr9p KNAG_0K02630 [Huiozyma naganishii CBS 8797]|uniref:RNA polymerase-associated protein CTR9 n=1 Tax=Huiozyma naganishii (strain ATCC MYA-139 / BCRC 22969 / CBS 8797 / KCTC 17520 / NBRC 10181 / NCYC 3082 / Yp74L-3) TaxID=1071383 RepID=J7SB05_HUIN7|nr:hypothetical protein KNAG_0K02630 [Kazachstania naganishii CBS 8797]CCK72626.1 hypothetical protein KNAG_0K02630 [Kazachstania naganishii CBS 8797]